MGSKSHIQGFWDAHSRAHTPAGKREQSKAKALSQLQSLPCGTGSLHHLSLMHLANGQKKAPLQRKHVSPNTKCRHLTHSGVVDTGISDTSKPTLGGVRATASLSELATKCKNTSQHKRPRLKQVHAQAKIAPTLDRKDGDFTAKINLSFEKHWVADEDVALGFASQDGDWADEISASEWSSFLVQNTAFTWGTVQEQSCMGLKQLAGEQAQLPPFVSVLEQVGASTSLSAPAPYQLENQVALAAHAIPAAHTANVAHVSQVAYPSTVSQPQAVSQLESNFESQVQAGMAATTTTININAAVEADAHSAELLGNLDQFMSKLSRSEFSYCNTLFQLINTEIDSASQAVFNSNLQETPSYVAQLSKLPAFYLQQLFAQSGFGQKLLTIVEHEHCGSGVLLNPHLLQNLQTAPASVATTTSSSYSSTTTTKALSLKQLPVVASSVEQAAGTPKLSALSYQVASSSAAPAPSSSSSCSATVVAFDDAATTLTSSAPLFPHKAAVMAASQMTLTALLALRHLHGLSESASVASAGKLEPLAQSGDKRHLITVNPYSQVFAQPMLLARNVFKFLQQPEQVLEVMALPSEVASESKSSSQFAFSSQFQASLKPSHLSSIKSESGSKRLSNGSRLGVDIKAVKAHPYDTQGWENNPEFQVKRLFRHLGSQAAVVETAGEDCHDNEQPSVSAVFYKLAQCQNSHSRPPKEEMLVYLDIMDEYASNHKPMQSLLERYSLGQSKLSSSASSASSSAAVSKLSESSFPILALMQLVPMYSGEYGGQSQMVVAFMPERTEMPEVTEMPKAASDAAVLLEHTQVLSHKVILEAKVEEAVPETVIADNVMAMAKTRAEAGLAALSGAEMGDALKAKKAADADESNTKVEAALESQFEIEATKVSAPLSKLRQSYLHAGVTPNMQLLNSLLAQCLQERQNKQPEAICADQAHSLESQGKLQDQQPDHQLSEQSLALSSALVAPVMQRPALSWFSPLQLQHSPILSLGGSNVAFSGFKPLSKLQSLAKVGANFYKVEAAIDQAQPAHSARLTQPSKTVRPAQLTPLAQSAQFTQLAQSARPSQLVQPAQMARMFEVVDAQLTQSKQAGGALSSRLIGQVNNAPLNSVTVSALEQLAVQDESSLKTHSLSLLEPADYVLVEKFNQLTALAVQEQSFKEQGAALLKKRSQQWVLQTAMQQPGVLRPHHTRPDWWDDLLQEQEQQRIAYIKLPQSAASLASDRPSPVSQLAATHLSSNLRSASLLQPEPVHLSLSNHSVENVKSVKNVENVETPISDTSEIEVKDEAFDAIAVAQSWGDKFTWKVWQEESDLSADALNSSWLTDAESLRKNEETAALDKHDTVSDLDSDWAVLNPSLNQELEQATLDWTALKQQLINSKTSEISTNQPLKRRDFAHYSPLVTQVGFVERVMFEDPRPSNLAAQCKGWSNAESDVWASELGKIDTFAEPEQVENPWWSNRISKAVIHTGGPGGVLNSCMLQSAHKARVMGSRESSMLSALGLAQAKARRSFGYSKDQRQQRPHPNSFGSTSSQTAAAGFNNLQPASAPDFSKLQAACAELINFIDRFTALAAAAAHAKRSASHQQKELTFAFVNTLQHRIFKLLAARSKAQLLQAQIQQQQSQVYVQVHAQAVASSLPLLTPRQQSQAQSQNQAQSKSQAQTQTQVKDQAKSQTQSQDQTQHQLSTSNPTQSAAPSASRQTKLPTFTADENIALTCSEAPTDSNQPLHLSWAHQAQPRGDEPPSHRSKSAFPLSFDKNSPEFRKLQVSPVLVELNIQIESFFADTYAEVATPELLVPDAWWIASSLPEEFKALLSQISTHAHQPSLSEPLAADGFEGERASALVLSCDLARRWLAQHSLVLYESFLYRSPQATELDASADQPQISAEHGSHSVSDVLKAHALFAATKNYQSSKAQLGAVCIKKGPAPFIFSNANLATPDIGRDNCAFSASTTSTPASAQVLNSTRQTLALSSASASFCNTQLAFRQPIVGTQYHETFEADDSTHFYESTHYVALSSKDSLMLFTDGPCTGRIPQVQPATPAPLHSKLYQAIIQSSHLIENLSEFLNSQAWQHPNFASANAKITSWVNPSVPLLGTATASNTSPNLESITTTAQTKTSFTPPQSQRVTNVEVVGTAGTLKSDKAIAPVQAQAPCALNLNPDVDIAATVAFKSDYLQANVPATRLSARAVFDLHPHPSPISYLERKVYVHECPQLDASLAEGQIVTRVGGPWSQVANFEKWLAPSLSDPVAALAPSSHIYTFETVNSELLPISKVQHWAKTELLNFILRKSASLGTPSEPSEGLFETQGESVNPLSGECGEVSAQALRGSGAHHSQYSPSSNFSLSALEKQRSLSCLATACNVSALIDSFRQTEHTATAAIESIEATEVNSQNTQPQAHLTLSLKSESMQPSVFVAISSLSMQPEVTSLAATSSTLTHETASQERELAPMCLEHDSTQLSSSSSSSSSLSPNSNLNSSSNPSLSSSPEVELLSQHEKPEPPTQHEQPTLHALSNQLCLLDNAKHMELMAAAALSIVLSENTEPTVYSAHLKELSPSKALQQAQAIPFKTAALKQLNPTTTTTPADQHSLQAPPSQQLEQAQTTLQSQTSKLSPSCLTAKPSLFNYYSVNTKRAWIGVGEGCESKFMRIKEKLQLIEQESALASKQALSNTALNNLSDIFISKLNPQADLYNQSLKTNTHIKDQTQAHVGFKHTAAQKTRVAPYAQLTPGLNPSLESKDLQSSYLALLQGQGALSLGISHSLSTFYDSERYRSCGPSYEQKHKPKRNTSHQDCQPSSRHGDLHHKKSAEGRAQSAGGVFREQTNIQLVADEISYGLERNHLKCQQHQIGSILERLAAVTVDPATALGIAPDLEHAYITCEYAHLNQPALELESLRFDTSVDELKQNELRPDTVALNELMHMDEPSLSDEAYHLAAVFNVDPHSKLGFNPKNKSGISELVNPAALAPEKIEQLALSTVSSKKDFASNDRVLTAAASSNLEAVPSHQQNLAALETEQAVEIMEELTAKTTIPNVEENLNLMAENAACTEPFPQSRAAHHLEPLTAAATKQDETMVVIADADDSYECTEPHTAVTAVRVVWSAPQEAIALIDAVRAKRQAKQGKLQAQTVAGSKAQTEHKLGAGVNAGAVGDQQPGLFADWSDASAYAKYAADLPSYDFKQGLLLDESHLNEGAGIFTLALDLYQSAMCGTGIAYQQNDLKLESNSWLYKLTNLSLATPNSVCNNINTQAYLDSKLSTTQIPVTPQSLAQKIERSTVPQSFLGGAALLPYAYQHFALSPCQKALQQVLTQEYGLKLNVSDSKLILSVSQD